MTTLKIDGRYYDADSIRDMEQRLAQRDAEVERLRRENDVFAASLREMGVSVEQLRKNVSDAHRAFGAALSTPTETATAGRDVSVSEAARVLLDGWLAGAFEDGADAAADDAITAQWAHVDRTYPDAAPVIEAWLRALASQDKGERT